MKSAACLNQGSVATIVSKSSPTFRHVAAPGSFNAAFKTQIRTIQPHMQRQLLCKASQAEGESSQPAPAPAAEAETVFYEGSGSNAELAINLLLGATLLYLPLTMQSIGRRLWIKYKFTSKRVIVTTNSPVLKREIQVEYSKIKEIRTAPRAFGLWGDCVIFLKDGSRLELVGLEDYARIKDYVEGKISD